MTREDLLKDLKATFGLTFIKQETGRVILAGIKMPDDAWIAKQALDVDCKENHDFLTGLHDGFIAWLANRGFIARRVDG